MALLATAKDDAPSQKSISESSDLILRNPQYGMDIASMLSKVPPAQQTWYANVLSQAKNGWTPATQKNTSSGIIRLLDTRVAYVM